MVTRKQLETKNLPIFTKINLLLHIAPELGDIYVTDKTLSVMGRKPLAVNNISALEIHDIIYKE